MSRARASQAVAVVAAASVLLAVSAVLGPAPVGAATRAPALSVGSSSIWEGDAGTRTLKIPVTLSSPSTVAVSVSYQVIGSSGSATSADFKAKSGTLTWNVGASGVTGTSKTVAVTVLSDQVHEPTEAVSLILSNPTGGATLANGVGVSTIYDDDPTLVYGYRIDAGNVAIGEGDGGNVEPAAIPVTLSAPAPTSITVNYAITGGSAVYGTDYKGTRSGTITFPAGAIEKTITLNVLPDGVDESDENVIVTLSGATGNLAYLIDGSGTLTIQSSEYRGLSGGPKVGVAGDSITFVAAGAIEGALASRYRVWVTGLPGYRIAGVQPSITSQVATSPQAMVINLGTNDVGAHDGTWRSAFDAMVASLASVPCIEMVTINAKVSNYYATVNNDLDGDKVIDPNEIVTVAYDINDAIRATAAADPRFHIIDWDALVAPNALAYTTDGIHPNAAGQAWLASSTRAAVDRDCAA